MKALLGADAATGLEAPAAILLKRLRFNASQVEVARVVVPPLTVSWEMAPGMLPLSYPDLIEADEKRAKELTAEVAASFDGGVATVLHGSPAGELLRRAEESGADLIAVNGHEDSPLIAFLIGSTARSLVLGAKQSVLLAKPDDEPADAPVRAVLATDHSEYADRACEKLLRFWPRGLEHVTILSSYPEDRLKALEPMLPPLGISPTGALHDQLESKNEALAEKLRAFCPSVETLVSPLPVHEAIAMTMTGAKADLLILGARGHGFLERLTVGSVALQEALTLPHSVLVLRN